MRAVILRHATHAMATRFEVAVEGGDEAQLRAVAELAFEEVHDCDARLSAFRADSAIGRINAAAGSGDWVAIDDDTLALLQRCVDLHRATDGAFDISIGPLMHAHGFRESAAAAPGPVGLTGLRIDPPRGAAMLTHAGMQLDLGGIGKGHALDAAAAVLREHGVARALLHGGTSTAIAIGAPHGAPGFRIALRTPPDRPAHVVLRDAALSVSSRDGQTATTDSRTVGHVFDPRRGTEAHGFHTTAVLAPRAETADAWSTALLVGGTALSSRAPTAAMLTDETASWQRCGPDSDNPTAFTFLDPLEAHAPS